jgi:mono/diheme cytochrome c family protein
VALLAVLAAGCSSAAPEFTLNSAYLRKWERQFREDFSDRRKREIRDITVALFGTPQRPRVPTLRATDAHEILDVDRLDVAAGPIGRDNEQNVRGLYREHCADCHGVSGDGVGPTARFLYPYPRDFRPGVFKYKSTPKGEKPTDEDLRQILFNGIAGTAMPAYRALPDEHLDSLVEYVKYLSIRGEVERSLIDLAAELEPDEPIIDLDAWQERRSRQTQAVLSLTERTFANWERAEAAVTPIVGSLSGRDMLASVDRGRELFFGDVANCVKCHGETGRGDGQTTDHDDWTKELEPANREAVAEYKAAGALAPRTIRPRNLQQGVFRGGQRPIDLFYRIRNGIDGTPMPAALMKPQDAAPSTLGLTETDIWCLVAFVRSIPKLGVGGENGIRPGHQKAGF